MVQPDAMTDAQLDFSHVADGWLNSMTGLGTERDRRKQYGVSKERALTDVELQILHDENWLARRIVELLPQQALRKKPTGPSDEEWAKWEALDKHELYPHGVFRQGLYAGRLFGGALILGGFERGLPTDPAPEPGTGSALRWIDVVPWRMLTVDRREPDANSPRYKLPLILRITGDHPRSGLSFHISRTVACEGLPRAQPKTSDLTPWLSVLQPLHDTLRDYDVAWASVSNLIEEASVGVLKLQGLFKMLAEKDQELARQRMQIISASKSAIRTLFLDADGNESFERTEVSFAALPQLMQQVNLRMAGGADLPATKLFGQEPAGMNATGESDIRQFYDSVAEYRNSSVAPKLVKLLSWALGKQVQLDWPSLWEQTDKEKAETRFLNAQADKIWAVDVGAVNALDVALSRIADGSLGLDVDEATIRADIAKQEADKEAAAAAEAARLEQQQQQPVQPNQPAPPVKQTPNAGTSPIVQ